VRQRQLAAGRTRAAGADGTDTALGEPRADPSRSCGSAGRQAVTGGLTVAVEVGGDAIAEHGVGAGDVLAACRRREVGGQLGEHHEHAAHELGGHGAAPEGWAQQAADRGSEMTAVGVGGELDDSALELGTG
jgi:hypothetical protein